MWKYYIFSLSLFCGGILFSPPSPSLPHPPAYSHSSGINDKEEWIQRRGGGGGWMGNGPPQLNVSGSSVAAGQRRTAANKFAVIPRGLAYHSHVPPTPCIAPSPNTPFTSPERGGGRAGSDKTEVKQLQKLWKQRCWCHSDSVVS